VEMGEHFWTVVLPRMKKVLAYDKSGISKEQDVKEHTMRKLLVGFQVPNPGAVRRCAG